MTSLRSAALLLASGFGAGALADAAPSAAELRFDGDIYLAAGQESDASRIAEHFIRAGETLERYSRRLTIADQPEATSVKQLGLGIIAITKLRTPGLETSTFAAEGDEDRDLTMTWFALADDNSSVEFHAARFVALRDAKGASRGVREYHFVSREYTNGRHPDEVFSLLAPVVAGFADRWVDELQTFNRAPVTAPKGK